MWVALWNCKDAIDINNIFISRLGLYRLLNMCSKTLNINKYIYNCLQSVYILGIILWAILIIRVAIMIKYTYWQNIY